MDGGKELFMMFHLDSSEIFVPDDLLDEQALERTTHIAVAAHQDDIEIMAAAPILACFQKADKWFTGVVVTDGGGSPRSGLYKDYSDQEMRLVRIKEQKKAAVVGEYAAQIMLDYPSKIIKDSTKMEAVIDIEAILKATNPKIVYTHNLADKHDTHVAVALRVIQALRNLPETVRPDRVYGCEVWRDLDWMLDNEKVPFDLSSHENLQSALVGVFDSQIAGGKRYDIATLGRRRANATFFESHGVDSTQRVTFGMDLTPLIINPRQDIAAYIDAYVRRFAKDVADRIARFQ
jgi:LmbE family N-acetylglucosaminyl deacetylase